MKKVKLVDSEEMERGERKRGEEASEEGRRFVSEAICS